MTDLLMKVAGFKSDCLKMRPCLYVSKSSSIFRIGQHIYHRCKGRDMGVKRKIFGRYVVKEKSDGGCVTWSCDTPKIAVCKMRDFCSSFELDPYIREKLNFSYKEICDITDSWKQRYMEKYDPNGEKKIFFYLSYFKIGVNDDGSDIPLLAEFNCQFHLY